MTHRSQIDALLKSADEALIKTKIVENGVVNDGYDSAIAAFGPIVTLSGLMPAMAFYCATGKDDKRKTDKSKVITAIALTLLSKYNKNDEKALFSFCLENDNNRSISARLRDDIVNASIALKIMVRTYKIPEGDGQE
ncbi:MAG: type III-B CRISPR module-associated protein Cmr5 [Prolixibacteraceae bacterium]|jgi:hypothetical protein|nr:type III-B CRISPR module-associated protein Cmr5 [Prolixibacteraceae bacterium]